jgi:hypothetical protein
VHSEADEEPVTIKSKYKEKSHMGEATNMKQKDENEIVVEMSDLKQPMK